MADYIGLLPLGANLGFSVPIVSYNQALYFTMMAAPNLMPDPDRMKSLVEQVFEELKRAAVAKSVPVAAVPAAAVPPPRVELPKYTGTPLAGVNNSPRPGLAASRPRLSAPR